MLKQVNTENIEAFETLWGFNRGFSVFINIEKLLFVLLSYENVPLSTKKNITLYYIFFEKCYGGCASP